MIIILSFVQHDCHFHFWVDMYHMYHLKNAYGFNVFALLSNGQKLSIRKFVKHACLKWAVVVCCSVNA